MTKFPNNGKLALVERNFDKSIFLEENMRILICDDEEECLNEMKIHVEEYMKNHYVKAEFFTTTSSKEILENDIPFDLALLDIQMDEADGISIAKELKKRNGKVVLFFVTAFDEYQDEAMDLHIFRFFEKPLNIERLYSGLDKALNYIDEAYVDVFLYNNGSQMRIAVEDIVYLERANRRVIIVTKDESYEARGSLEDWNNKLPHTFFYLVHKSFLVNLHYITKYSYSEIYMNNSIRISVAPRKQSEFHKYWFNYLKRR